MRGDILLFSSNHGLFDALIKRFTGGRFTHAEIDLGDGTWVGEHSNGLVRHKAGPVDARITISSFVSSADLEEGMAWVEEQIKAAGDPEAREYGVFSILSDALKILGLNFALSRTGEWDCSEFACYYLHYAHAASALGKLRDDCVHVSPNDLARAFGVPTK